MHRCVASVFADIFRDLERNCELDPLNVTDLYCQHYIFLPCINKCLKSLRRVGTTTLFQVSGVGLFLEGLNAVTEFQSQGSTADVDLGVAGEQISVPRMKFFPCSCLLQRIHTIDPLQLCSDNGVALFYSYSCSRSDMQCVLHYIISCCEVHNSRHS